MTTSFKNWDPSISILPGQRAKPHAFDLLSQSEFMGLRRWNLGMSGEGGEIGERWWYKTSVTWRCCSYEMTIYESMNLWIYDPCSGAVSNVDMLILVWIKCCDSCRHSKGVTENVPRFPTLLFLFSETIQDRIGQFFHHQKKGSSPIWPC